MTKNTKPSQGLRLQATQAARLRYKSKIQQVAVAAIEDLKSLNKHDQSVFCHVFDFEGHPVVVATQVDKDRKGVFVDLDIGDGIPRRTIMQADVPRRSRAEAEFSKVSKQFAEEDQEENY